MKNRQSRAICFYISLEYPRKSTCDIVPRYRAGGTELCGTYTIHTEEQRWETKRQRERDGRREARERRNGTPGTRCYPIIAFALPFHVAKWQKCVSRFFVTLGLTILHDACFMSASRCRCYASWWWLPPTRVGAICQRGHNYPYCASAHLYIAYQVPG